MSQSMDCKAEQMFYNKNKNGGIDMEMTTTTSKPNIRRLTDYINSQATPELFAAALFAFAKPRFQDLADAKQELQIRVG